MDKTELYIILDELRQKLDKDNEYSLELKSNKRRSMDANRYMWVLCDRIANVIKSTKDDVYRQAIQAVGVLIPTMTANPVLIILSGVFYGGTFVGLVALFMSLGGKLAGNNPVILMGALTTAYGIGQVIAPLYAVVLTDWSGNYNYALYVTATIIMGGIGLLIGAKKILKVKY